ncbi:type VI secretion system tube protein TssD [Sinomicrobium weinanense]|uniref:Uncharacterized protein n=1 Tax=Sinomicrobium weinanense TaxID=2842200 RepID=A0A926Q5R9_9FLAO|nr:type VI secretion system tube protein TssD [Sinomicrobium weinanense]MBC9798280.1 hypothetical protein [Sinomicrobium weinanense]MBU3125090.1 hypothetical protein [Sinomicrobium weinanense]
MIVQGKLYVEDEVCNLLAFDLLFEQGTDWSGKPSRRPQLEGIFVQIESTNNDELFHHWITSNDTMKQGKIVFYGPDGMKEQRKYEFWDCYCVNWKEDFKHNTEEPMGMSMKLMPGIFKTPGGTIAEKPWKISDPFTAYKSYEPEEDEDQEEEETLTGYKLYTNGCIELICSKEENDAEPIDYLYNEDMSKKIEVQDKSILYSLSHNDKKSNVEVKDLSFAIVRDFNEAARVFKFAADNSNVEWGFDGHKPTEASKEVYFVGTYRNQNLAPNSETALGVSIFNQTFRIHSHPYPHVDIDKDLDWGIGDMKSVWMQNQIHGKVIRPPKNKGDVLRAQERYERFEKAGKRVFNHYHYFPQKGLYYYDPFIARKFVSSSITRNIL